MKRNKNLSKLIFKALVAILKYSHLLIPRFPDNIFIIYQKIRFKEDEEKKNQLYVLLIAACKT